MLPFAESFGAWTAVTLLPALAGLALIALLGGLLAPRYAAAFGLGIFLWFFVDTIQGSSNLLVNEGFNGGGSQASALLLFLFGALALFAIDRDLFAQASPGARLRRSVPFVVALAIGVHGLGEGLAFGYTSSSTTSPDLLSAFGGVSEGAAYVLHKALEPMMAGAVYLAYSKRLPGGAGQMSLELVSMAVVFALPSLLGAAAGYLLAPDATYAYALGAGAAVYAAVRLGREALGPAETPSGREPLKFGAALVVGFILIYLAALLHG